MVQRLIVELLDDLDDGTADETVSFGLDGRAYEIDLSAKNAQKLRRALAKYVSAARRVGATRRAALSQPNAISGTSAATGEANLIRVWARAQGLEVRSRGRIPAHLQQAYESR